MRILVRSWNVFHGRTYPPGRTAHLREAVQLAVRDEPDVVCLQEVPVWGFRMLAGWSGMAAVTGRTIPAGLGPVPLPLRLTRRLTDLHHGRLRSLLTGQGNAVLVTPRLRVIERASLVLNDRALRRDRRAELSLPRSVRLRWAAERRIAQAVRIELAAAATLLVVNVHLSHLGEGIADVELARAASFADETASQGEPVVLAGDFNVVPARSATLGSLVAGGYSRPGPGIDHVLVRGAAASPLRVWPDEERRVGGRLLSDHAPVEVVLEVDVPGAGL